MRIFSKNLTACLAAVTMVCGCGSHAGDGASSRSKASAAVRKATNPADGISPNMVSAVAQNKTTTVPVEVRFEIKDKPDVSQPLDVDLVIVPLSASVERVAGKVESEDGLELVDGAQISPSERPPEGVPIRHTIKVQPKREGIFIFSAVITVDAAGQTSTQTFSMPVIAGAGMPDLNAQPAAPKTKTAASANPPLNPALAAAKPAAGHAATQ